MPSRFARCLLLAAILVPGTGVPTLAQDGADTETPIAIAIGDNGCDPIALEAPAGPITFEIDNVAGDAGEFEVLAGDRVLDEAENILPGVVVEMRVRLDAGSYDLVCYRTRLARGTLTVTGGAAATAPPNSVVDPAVLDGYVTTYHRWVQDQAAQLVTAVDQFAAAITTADLDAARALYPKVREPWERIEPVAETRLAGEPLGEYLQVQGGGYFFALPGVTGPDRFLGDGLLG